MKNLFILLFIVLLCGIFGVYIEENFTKQLFLTVLNLYVAWFTLKCHRITSECLAA